MWNLFHTHHLNFLLIYFHLHCCRSHCCVFKHSPHAVQFYISYWICVSKAGGGCRLMWRAGGYRVLTASPTEGRWRLCMCKEPLWELTWTFIHLLYRPCQPLSTLLHLSTDQLHKAGWSHLWSCSRYVHQTCDFHMYLPCTGNKQ